MGLDADAAPLVAEIDREAEAQRERILGEARAKAAEIEAAAEARIRSAREDALRLTQKLARADEDRLLGQARLEAQAERQQGLRIVYQRVFDAAREHLQTLADSLRYPAAMKALIREAVEAAPQASVLSVAVADVELCRGILREMERSCQVTGQDLRPGSVIASTADGKVRVDNSLGVRLATAEVVLETRITRCLNG
jgi:vacuolar-type H+-ATPase subunit E/Vma4